jgi:hypothetical protein
VSQASEGITPYRVVDSGLCREETRQLLARARAKGRFAEIAQAVRDIHTRLEWIPLDFGEPLREFEQLGIQTRIGTIAPLVVRFGVDHTRRVVYVSLPFDLLPKSGL